MLFERIFLDIVNPLMISHMLLFEASVIIIEGLIIYFLMERRAATAFLASFTANLITGLLSLSFLISFMSLLFYTYSTYTILAVSLIINILVEAGVLKMFYKEKAARDIFRVSTVMNVASYALLVIYYTYLISL